MSLNSTAVAPDRDERVRRMGLSDLDFVVGQHLDHFPQNPFSRLGPAFLGRYYRTFLDGPHAAASVATLHDEPVGYLVGILDAIEHRRLLRRYHGRALVASAFRGSLQHPPAAAPLVRHRAKLALARRSPAPGTERDGEGDPETSQDSSRDFSPDPTLTTGPDAGRLEASAAAPTPLIPPIAVLSHVAVTAQAQGLGIGRALITDFVLAARFAGAHSACVATTAGDDGPGEMYQRLGWQLTRERDTFDRRRIALYELDLRS